MNQITKIWCVIVGLIAVTIILLAWRSQMFWWALPLAKKTVILEIFQPYSGYIIFVALLFFAGIISVIILLFNIFIVPLRSLIEETNLIKTVNSEHRINAEETRFYQGLAESINELADRFSISQKNIEKEISLSKAEIEREKNILAAFIGELHDGVLICTAEGSIMFYNKRAKELFAPKNNDNGTDLKTDKPKVRPKEAFVGIGRSIFNIINKNLIVHALDEVAAKLHQTDSYVASHFVVATSAGKLLRIETVPVLNKKLQLSGFVFSANDITERLQQDSRMDQLMQSLMKKIRASAGGIRSSIETILTFPDMDTVSLERFRTIIHNESLALGKVVEDTVAGYPEYINTRWPLVPMNAEDLIETTRRKAGNSLGVSLYIERSAKDAWVKVESYCAKMIILFVLNQLKDETDNLDFFCKTEQEENFVNIDISWKGSPVLIKTLRNWNMQRLMIRNEGLELTLREVLVHHGANLWSHAFQERSDRSALRIIFPACEHREPEIKKSITILTEESRPVFYDFNLFQQQGQTPLVDSRLLSDLEFTVFDTETTGLAPRGGDEIISIGAVRVVNGQVLQEELFDQLVDPQRDIPVASIRIHGIQPEMVKGQPTIAAVLASFQDFCDNTVLVAHNAAFDMLMLKMKEEVTGIKFINPVVDTLLLWDILHPAQGRNNFGAIAEMLGVRIVGRHTALGDALTTAEVFSKMIPLLAEKGINTLQDARLASQKSKYAGLEF